MSFQNSLYLSFLSATKDVKPSHVRLFMLLLSVGMHVAKTSLVARVDTVNS